MTDRADEGQTAPGRTTSGQAGWRHVGGPSPATDPVGADETPGPDETAPAAGTSPAAAGRPRGVRIRGRSRRPARASEPLPSRGRRLLIGLVISALLIMLAAAGGYFVSHLAPDVVTTQTQTATRPPFAMQLPLQVGEYSRDANQGNTPTKNADGKTTLSATYTKGGQPAFVLLLARPYSDGKQFMLDLNMNAVTSLEDGMCGVSGDNSNSGCSVIRDDTGILVLSTVDMSRADLMALTHRIAQQVAGS